MPICRLRVRPHDRGRRVRRATATSARIHSRGDSRNDAHRLATRGHGRQVGRVEPRESSKEKGWVRVQNSIGLGPLESAPEPDVWLARRDYSQGAPHGGGRAAGDRGGRDQPGFRSWREGRSVRRGRHRRLLDRRSGVPLDRSPPRPGRGRYRSVQTVTGDEPVHPLAAPEITLRPTDLQL